MQLLNSRLIALLLSAGMGTAALAQSAPDSATTHTPALAATSAATSATTTTQRGRGGNWLLQRDADGDGKVSREEFREYTLKRIRAFDKNGDGVIEPGEMPAGGARMLQGAEGEKFTLDVASSRSLGRFARMDVNGDGFITSDEMNRTRRTRPVATPTTTPTPAP